MSKKYKITKPIRKQSNMIEYNEYQLQVYLERQEFMCYDRQ